MRAHLGRQPLCAEWIQLKPGIKDYVDDKFNLPMTDREKEALNTKCFICNTTFANVGNLNRHLSTSIMCSKWAEYKNLEPLQGYITGKKLSSVQMFDFDGSESDNSDYETFVPVENSLCHHIIWNVFLTDKETAKQDALKQVIEENNIKCIVGILPSDSNFELDDVGDIELVRIPYSDHTMDVDYELFERACNKIEELRKDRHNVLVFCNNGYQRSIPFLCYYLTKHHADEVPEVARAIDIILPQVDKANYGSLRDVYVEQVQALLSPIASM